MKNNMTFIHEPSRTTLDGCFHMWSVKIALDIRNVYEVPLWENFRTWLMIICVQKQGNEIS